MPSRSVIRTQMHVKARRDSQRKLSFHEEHDDVGDNDDEEEDSNGEEEQHYQNGPAPENEDEEDVDDEMDFQIKDPNLLREIKDAAVTIQKVWRRKYNSEHGHEEGRFAKTVVEFMGKTKAKKMRAKIKDILIYFLFLWIFSKATLSDLQDDALFQFSNNAKEQFIGVEFNQEHSPTWGKTFKDIATVQELYQWFHGPFIAAAYSSSTFDGDETFRGNRKGFILGYGQVIGGIRIGQLRLQQQDCKGKISSMFSTLGQNISNSTDGTYSCYGSNRGKFFVNEEFRSSYGYGSEKFDFNGWNDTNTLSEREMLFSSIRTEFHSSFPSPAYSVVLPRENKTRAIELINYIQDNKYIDLHTRAIFVDVNIYNVMLGYVLVMRFITQMPAGGGVLPTYSVVTVPFTRNYLIGASIFDTVLNIAVVIFYLYFIGMEIVAIRKHRYKYFIKIETWIQDLNLFLYILVWVLRLTAVMHFPTEFPTDSDKFVTLRPYSEAFMSSQYFNACNAFLCWFKMIMYLEMIPQFALVTDTLAKAASGVSGFIIIFAIITYAYASAYSLTFGAKLKEYSTMNKTVASLLRSLLGDFDLDSMVREHWIMGILLFVMFVSVAVFVILNLLIAIISESYDKAQQDMKTKEDLSLVTEVLEYFRYNVQAYVKTTKEWLNGERKKKKGKGEDMGNVKSSFLRKQSELTQMFLKSLSFRKKSIFNRSKNSYLEKVHPTESKSEGPSISRFESSKQLGKGLGKSLQKNFADLGNKAIPLLKKSQSKDSTRNITGVTGGSAGGIGMLEDGNMRLLQGMILQLAHQNDRLQLKVEELSQNVDLLIEQNRGHVSSSKRSPSKKNLNKPSKN